MIRENTIYNTIILEMEILEKEDSSPVPNVPTDRPTDVYSGFLAMAFEFPGFFQIKPFLLLGMGMPLIDAILDFTSAGFV